MAITAKEIINRIAEMRGRDEVVRAEIETWVFGDKMEIYVSRRDAENWFHCEHVFVIPEDVSSPESMLARGFWAETRMFDLPIIMGTLVPEWD